MVNNENATREMVEECERKYEDATKKMIECSLKKDMKIKVPTMRTD